MFPTLLKVLLALSECEDIKCSNVIDIVCGMTATTKGEVDIRRYLNICHLQKAECLLQHIGDFQQVPDELCGIKKRYSNSRRVADFSIVGAHQACNHTCPTFCVDTYEPACVEIWKHDMTSAKLKTMINHCHVDLFSCTTGLNVTIVPLHRCFIDPSALLFMTQVAALKSLNLLDEGE